MRLPRRRIWRIVLGLTAGLAVVALVLGSRGRFDTSTPAALSPAARAASPGWTVPCWVRLPRRDRELVKFCARVEGRILYVHRNPLGVGWQELHFLVLAHRHVVAVKETTPIQAALDAHTGDTLFAIGPLVRSRLGIGEVEGFAIHANGLWWNNWLGVLEATQRRPARLGGGLGALGPARSASPSALTK